MPLAHGADVSFGSTSEQEGTLHVRCSSREVSWLGAGGACGTAVGVCSAGAASIQGRGWHLGHFGLVHGCGPPCS